MSKKYKYPNALAFLEAEQPGLLKRIAESKNRKASNHPLVVALRADEPIKEQVMGIVLDEHFGADVPHLIRVLASSLW